MDRPNTVGYLLEADGKLLEGVGDEHEQRLNRIVPPLVTRLTRKLMGRDEYAMRWIKAFRKREKAAQAQ